MRALRSLRGRVALAATLAVAAVLLAVGALAVGSFAQSEQARVDESLELRPARGLARAVAPAVEPHQFGPPGVEHGPDRVFLGPPALRPQGEYVRVVAGGRVLRAVDAPAGLPVPPSPGLRTLRAGPAHYRSLARPVHGDVLLEVGTDLRPTEGRVGALRRLLILLGAAGVALAGALSWWLAGLALRPLGGLRDAAGRVSTTGDLSTRLPATESPAEVEELSASINAMLARLQRSAGETEAALEATRRFAADSGHELRTPMTALRARLGVLRRNPDLEPSERLRTLEAAEQDTERTVRLLDALQTLARGDAGAVLPREPVDVSGAVEAAVEAARSRHPEITWRADSSPEDLCLHGWPDGVRAIVDNLLENAARHGRKAGVVEVSLGRDGDWILLTVDDDGPGVRASERERERIFERFARGEGVRGGGSGLGLALVRQQARLHGGDVSVGASPLGGARFVVRLAGDARFA